MLIQTNSAREARARRTARRQDLIVAKVREGSRWYSQYGPFMIVNYDNYVEAHSLDLDALERELA